VWFAQGLFEPFSRFSAPAPPFPGIGKWFKLGSAMMLLWKSSKLIGARKSMFSVVGLGSAFAIFPTLVDRRLKLLDESIVESMDEFPEWRYGPGLLDNKLVPITDQRRFNLKHTSIATSLVVVGLGAPYDPELKVFSYSSHLREARPPHLRWSHNW